MRRALPLALLSAILACTTSFLYAQHDRFAYAITDLSKEGTGWNALRRLDLESGQYSIVLLDGTDQKKNVFDASSRKPLSFTADARYGTMLQTPFGTGVAAAAYDRRHNRLYFTPMFVDQLRYIDLKTMKVYYVSGQAFTGLGNMHGDEAKIVTRMVIASDGYGYAITNDGNSMVRFSTGKKTRIERLGALVDDPSNKGVSIHNKCSSFGGDMISDERGNLYILSARDEVFKVDVLTKTATHLGPITGLEPNFTVNGAVVDGDGNLLVSSAVDGSRYYVVKPGSWAATAYTVAGSVFRSSDLANSNFLSLSKRTDELKLKPLQEKFAGGVGIYPNPVTQNEITLHFTKLPAGTYTVELRDALGRSVIKKNISLSGEIQTQRLSIQEGNTRGVYLIKIWDNKNRSVYTQKVVVQ